MNADPHPESDETDRRRGRPIVVSVCFAAFMATLDSYIVNVSLPALGRDFHLDLAQLSLVMQAFFLSMAAGTLVLGKLSDRWGHRRMFLGGYAVFTGASLLCGLAPAFALLVAARFLQGVGACMLLIAGFALLSHHLPVQLRGWGFGLLSLTSALGITVGAPLGGLLTGFLSWHWVFLINLPIGLAAMVYAARRLPPDRHAPPAAPFDFGGALLSVLTILILVLTLALADDLGWRALPVLGTAALTLLLGGAFAARERRAPDPLLDLGLLTDPSFRLALLAGMTAAAVMAGNNFLVPFFLELNQGAAPQETGFVLMVFALVAAAAGPLAGRWSDRVHPALLCALGMFLATFACLYLGMNTARPGLTAMLVFLALLGLGFALFLSPNTRMIMDRAPEGNQGSVSGILNLTNRLSLLLGVAFFQLLFSSLAPFEICHAGTETALSASVDRAFAFTYLVAAGFCLLSTFLSLAALPRPWRTALNRPTSPGSGGGA